ncbi:MAG: hypothetical protein EHM89_17085 [Acidobacteria bacterium]|nr:MAG: hypothetical protein EHM89_17085 [Acidobacteriota bacterium]
MIVLTAHIVMVLIRAPHGRRSRTVKVAKSRKGVLEIKVHANGSRLIGHRAFKVAEWEGEADAYDSRGLRFGADGCTDTRKLVQPSFKLQFASKRVGRW